jgi:hypothetical protein
MRPQLAAFQLRLIHRLGSHTVYRASSALMPARRHPGEDMNGAAGTAGTQARTTREQYLVGVKILLLLGPTFVKF